MRTEKLLGLNLPEQMIDEGKDCEKDLLLSNAEMSIAVVRMGAMMDDPVHIEIKII
jgi:hypothetical protein